MKCFYFSNGEEDVPGGGSMVVGNGNVKAPWAWSFSGSLPTTAAENWSSGLESNSEFCVRVFFQRKNYLRVFEFEELRAATKGFSKGLVVGEGGFGCVYKGVVEGGDDGTTSTEVAIKYLNRLGFQGHKEWLTEVNFLGVVNHPNLVKLVGYCAEDGERGIQRLLAYEYMVNRSLEDHLLCQVSDPLPWLLRLKIAVDAARGLAYLHEEMDFQLIFRDVKPSNILLDENFNAKLSDFGLARLGPMESVGHASSAVVGTLGYAAPEYMYNGRFTTKSDVWSFGVVLYELMTGRRSLDKNRPKPEQKLLDWVKPYVSDPKRIHNIMDPRLNGEYSLNSVQKLIVLANKCLTRMPKNRPKMSEAVESLVQIIELVENGSPEVVENENVLVLSLEKGRSYSRRISEFRGMLSMRARSIRVGIGGV